MLMTLLGIGDADIDDIDDIAAVLNISSVIDEMQKSPIEKRKRNLKTISPHSRGEREI